MTKPKRIAIVGGGIAGVTAAYELAKQARSGAEIEVVLFEASPRLGGIVETVREGGFIVECGPDGWVTEKPWASELAAELGLADPGSTRYLARAGPGHAGGPQGGAGRSGMSGC